MAEQGEGERTLPATPRRLEQAREQGQVARSRELATCLILLGAAGAMAANGPLIAERFSDILRAGLRFDKYSAFAAEAMTQQLSTLAQRALWVTLPLLGVLLAASLVAPLAVGGWLFSLKALAPAFSRLSPLLGLSRIFSSNGLVELIKAVAKSALMGAIGAWIIWGSLDQMLGLMEQSPQEGVDSFGRLMSRAFLILAAGLSLIALIDVPFQLYQHRAKLRMSLEEVKREARESEGNPQLKARIRSQQRDMARRRMMAAVPKADVVITNPTHFAVALRYQDGKMRAPKLVAKGAGTIAQRIREVAHEHNVPTLEAPPLARALYRHAEVGDEIPNGLYNVVAKVLAYVHHLRFYQTHGGPRHRTRRLTLRFPPSSIYLRPTHDHRGLPR